MTSSKWRGSSLLPLELVEEILQRIPMGSLVRFKSTCKEWYTLLSDKRFIYKHFDLSQKRFLQGWFMRGADKSIQLVNPETQAHMCLPIPEEFHSHNLVPTIHCDGLLLCEYTERGSYGDTNRKVAVWNPFLSQVKWIKPSNSYKDHNVYGFGYDNNVSRENYKIVRFDNEFGKSSEVEIYEFKSKRWRSVDATETSERCVFYLSYQRWTAVSMNGNMYWVTRENKMDGSKTKTLIQSFDFSTETFKPICYVPEPFGMSYDQTVVTLSGYGGDRLCLLYEEKHVNVEVWVTNKVTDAVVSCSKYFSVTLPENLQILVDYSYFVHKTNKIMLWCVEVELDHGIDEEIMLLLGEVDHDIDDTYIRANVYEMGEGQIKKQVEAKGRYRSGDCLLTFGEVYVPSLVPVPE